MSSADDRVARDIGDEVTDELARIGLLYRVFWRAKTVESAQEKIEAKNYAEDGKHLQDALGVRVTTYFTDDLDLATTLLLHKYGSRHVDSTIDKPTEASFCPKRINHVFSLLQEQRNQLSVIRKFPKLVDPTFEIQLRTVFSEGWHEVEHDHRYKCKEDWAESEDLSRSLNGISATLETCDWAMLQLFDELALRHYRQRNWEAMLRNKYRLRFLGNPIGAELRDLLTRETGLARAVFRSDRNRILSALARSRVSIPITFDNVVFAANGIEIRNDQISSLTPRPIVEELARLM